MRKLITLVFVLIAFAGFSQTETTVNISILDSLRSLNGTNIGTDKPILINDKALLDYKGIIATLADTTTIDPGEGQLTYVADIDKYYVFDGTYWGEFSQGGKWTDATGAAGGIEYAGNIYVEDSSFINNSYTKASPEYYASATVTSDSAKIMAAIAAVDIVELSQDYDSFVSMVIPADKTLNFLKGGKITVTGALTGNNTRIICDKTKQCIDAGGIGGTWDLLRPTPEMFGAVGDGVTDDTKPFKQMIVASKTVELGSDKDYYFDNDESIYLDDVDAQGNGSSLICSNNYTTTKAFISVYGTVTATIKTIAIPVNRNDDTLSVNNVTDLFVGDMVFIESDEFFRQSSVVSTYPASILTQAGESKVITKITGNQLEFDCPMFDSYTTNITLTRVEPSTCNLSNLKIRKELPSASNTGIRLRNAKDCILDNVTVEKFHQNIVVFDCFNTHMDVHQIATGYVSHKIEGACSHLFLSGTAYFTDSEMECGGSVNGHGIPWNIHYQDFNAYTTTHIRPIVDAHLSTGSVYYERMTTYGGSNVISSAAESVYITDVHITGGGVAYQQRDYKGYNTGTSTTYMLTPMKELIINGMIVDYCTSVVNIKGDIGTFVLNNVVANNLSHSVISTDVKPFSIGSVTVSNIITNAPIYNGSICTDVFDVNNITLVTNDLTYDYNIFRFRDTTEINTVNINNFKMYNDDQDLWSFINSTYANNKIGRINITNSNIDCRMTTLDASRNFFDFGVTMADTTDISISNTYINDSLQWNYFISKTVNNIDGLKLKLINNDIVRESTNWQQNFDDIVYTRLDDDFEIQDDGIIGGDLSVGGTATMDNLVTGGASFDGNIMYVGTFWDAIQIDITTSGGTGASDLETFGGGGLLAPAFDGTTTNETVYFNALFNGKVKALSDIKTQIHMIPSTEPVSTDTVVLAIEHSWGSVGDIFTTSPDTTIIDIPIGSYSQWEHIFTTIDTLTAIGNQEVSSFVGRLTRLQDDVSDTYAHDLFIPTLSLQYEVDKPGFYNDTPDWFAGSTKYIEFGGTDEYINAGNTADFTTDDFTISMWVKRTTTGGSVDYTITKYQGNNDYWYLYFYYDKPRFRSRLSGSYNYDLVTTTATITDTDWHHIFLEIDQDNSANTQFYVDGVAVTTTKTTHIQSDNTNTGDLLIGKFAALFFTGSIDEVGIYNKLLTAKEKIKLFGGNTVTTTGDIFRITGLQGGWRMGESYTWDGTDITVPNLIITEGDFVSDQMEESDIKTH